MEIRFVRGADGDIYMLRYERILDAMIAGFKNPLGGGFKYFFFSPLFGGDDPIWLAHIFQMGWFNHQLVLLVTVNSIELYYVITPKKKTQNMSPLKGRGITPSMYLIFITRNSVAVSKMFSF